MITAFRLRLALLAGVGVALRVAYVLTVSRHTALGLDSVWYDLVGGFVESGKGVIDPGTLFNYSRAVPTASWPPLYPGYLAVVIALFGQSIDTLRIAGCLPAAITIVLTGVVARRVLRDETLALVAALLVTLSPLVIATDMSLMSEVLSVPFTLALMLAGQMLLERASMRRFLFFGALAGCAALVRPDVLIMTLVLLVLLFAAHHGSLRPLLLGGLGTIGAVVLVIAPWSVRNDTQLGTFSLDTTSSASVVAGANCADTYRGYEIGYWDFRCIDNAGRTPDNEVSWSHRILDKGLGYAVGHWDQVPETVGARVLRTWGAWDPVQLSRLEAVETRNRTWQLIGWLFEVPVLALAGLALIDLRHRWRQIVVLLAPLAAVTVVAALTYGNQRFRAPAEPALAALAAWKLCALVRSVRRRRSTTPELATPRSG